MQTACDLTSLTYICGHVYKLDIKLQVKCQLITELYNNTVALQLKLLFYSQILNNNTCHFPNWQKIQDA